VDAVLADYRTAPLEPKVKALLDWCVQMTRSPVDLGESDVKALVDQGWSDEEISAAGFLCAYFNFINRVAEGLGVDHEVWMEGRPPLGPCPW
jgi:alkylhydroperoxidase family enzyme